MMDMKVEELDGVTNIVLNGRLDIAGAGAIDQQFNDVASSKRALVVDLSGVSFLASLGIRVLVMGAKAVRANGGRIALLSPEASVTNVLRGAGIDQIIPVVADRSSALATVKP
jgi:anti-sigma B factor antagonist